MNKFSPMSNMRPGSSHTYNVNRQAPVSTDNSGMGHPEYRRGGAGKGNFATWTRTALLVVACLGFAVYSCLAGQSLQSSPTASAGISASNVPDHLDIRLELQLHNFRAPSTTMNVSWLSFFDTQITAYAQGTVTFFVRNAACTFSPVGKNMLIRIQATVAQNLVTCESWNVDGTNYEITRRTVNTWPIFTTHNGSFPAFGSTGGWRLGFMRGFTSTVPLRSRPPVTADIGNYFDWKFDGNGNDSSGNGRTVNTTSSSFSDTPAQTAYSLPSQPTAKSWAPSMPMRAGFPNELASNSYSMIDSSAEVSCYWQQVGGPSKLNWINRSSCTPKVSGAIFGQYNLRLRVTDAGGNTATSDYAVGAVAYDDNGVVIYPYPGLAKLIGPTMVMGANPWEFADAKHWEMFNVKSSFYAINGGTLDSDHVYTTVDGVPRLGTITRLKGSPHGTSIFGNGTNFLEVFCAGRPGPAIPGAHIFVKLGLAKDDPQNAQPFALLPVFTCVSDTEATTGGGGGYPGYIPEPGMPWSSFGLMQMTKQGVTGTVYIDPAVNARKLYGVGTNLRTVFCNGGTAPADKNVILIFASDYVDTRGIASCESETEITLASDFPQTAIASPGVNWIARFTHPTGTFTKLGGAAAFNLTFYDTPIAHYIHWMRTGLNAPRDAFRWLTGRTWNLPDGENRYNTWVSAILLHEFDDADLPSPLKDREQLWDLIKTPANRESYPGSVSLPVIYDQRESGYALLKHALFAQFHPNADVRAIMRTSMQTFYDRSLVSQNPDGSFRQQLQIVGHGTSNSFVMAHGSTTATLNTGTLPANQCGNTATFYSDGNITSITNGSTSIVGAGVNWSPHVGKEIFLRGTKEGQPWSQRNRLDAAPTSTTGTLRYPWYGDSNSVTAYRLGEALPLVTIQVNSTNTALLRDRLDEEEWYWCTVTSGTTVELDKPYLNDTSGGNVYRRLAMNNWGHSTSTFMNSILATALFYAADVDELDPTLATNFREVGRKVMNHLRALSEPLGYGRLPYWETNNPMCGGYNGPRPNWCSSTAIAQLKSFAIENVWSMSREYAAYGEEWRRDIADQWYTSLFHATGFQSPFTSVDPHTPPDTVTGYAFSGFNNLSKFYGQTFGMGNAQTWPAQRVGGVSQPVLRTTTIPYILDDIPAATRFRVIMYFPSGEVQTTECQESPCAVSVDERQGDHWILTQYLNAEGEVVAESARDLIRIR